MLWFYLCGFFGKNGNWRASACTCIYTLMFAFTLLYLPQEDKKGWHSKETFGVSYITSFIPGHLITAVIVLHALAEVHVVSKTLSHTHSTDIEMKKCAAYGEVTACSGMEDVYEHPQWIDNNSFCTIILMLVCVKLLYFRHLCIVINSMCCHI